MRIYFFLLLIACSTSCNTPKPGQDGILTKKEMEKVMWDYAQAEAFTEQFIKKDSSKDVVAENVRLQQQVFAINRVSKENFYKSFAYYSTKTDIMQSMLDSITVRAQRERGKVINLQVPSIAN